MGPPTTSLRPCPGALLPAPHQHQLKHQPRQQQQQQQYQHPGCLAAVSSTSGSFSSRLQNSQGYQVESQCCATKRPGPQRRGTPTAGALSRSQATAASLDQEAAQPQTVEFLQNAFGGQGVRFEAAVGLRTAELAIADGSSCRVIIDGARVSSYQAAMWHGGKEEVLYCGAREEADDTWQVLEGGLVLSFPSFGGLVVGQPLTPLACAAAAATWQVDAASSQRAKATLSLSTRGSHSVGGKALFWELQLKFSLTPAGLRVDLTATNPGFTPLHVAPSLTAHVAVADVEGCFLIGCQGRRYLPHKAEDQMPKLKTGGWWQGLLGGKKSGALEATVPALADAQPSGDGQEGDPDSLVARELLWDAGGAPEASLAEETADYAALRGGMHRLFPGGPEDITIVDRGMRRSFGIEGEGFGDFFVYNPGEASGLEEWPRFVVLGFGRGRSAVKLRPGASWSAALEISNVGTPTT